MAAEIVNLRQFRKQKARSEKEQNAADNRVKFGRNKSQKKHDKAETAHHSKKLEGHRLTPVESESETQEDRD
ncbi:MAG: DUF4169 family protein [Stappiaceae bacterium]